MAKRGKKIKPGQKWSFGKWPAVTSPRRKQYPEDIQGKSWREPMPSYVRLPMPDRPHIERRMYRDGNLFMIVDCYKHLNIVWESVVYNSRREAYEAHEYKQVTFVCQYPFTREGV